MNNSVHLSWEAPPTINLTSTEPDILYYVISLHIAHSGQNITVVVNTTEYIHEPNTDEWPWGLSLCDEVRFRVSAVNVVGEGNASDIVTGSYHRGLFKAFVQTKLENTCLKFLILCMHIHY